MLLYLQNVVVPKDFTAKMNIFNFLRTLFLSYGVVQVLLGGWRKSRSWVTAMALLVFVLFLVLVPLVSGFDKEPGLLELGLLAKYPEYQAVLKFKKRNGGGLNFKRNGGVPDECRGKYDTSIYTQVCFSTGLF